MPDFLEEAQSLFDYSRSLRRDFHQNPELAFEEVRTAGIIAKELSALGMKVLTGIGKTGVVGLLETGHPGPVILARFDMDALPIQEETGAPYASKNPGVMHACGHDGHMAIGLTVAKILAKYQHLLRGSVKLVFQPAEEGFGGAASMVADGVLEDPKPDVALALHLWNVQPVGWFGISAGPVMAAPDIFEITVKGKGGHGALPQLAVDPVYASAQIITALQSIVSRNVSPLDTAVVSVTMVHGGDAFNVIPEEVILKGTIRTFTKGVRQMVWERLNNIVTQVSIALGCEAEVKITDLSPAVVNDPQVTNRVQETALQIFPTGVVDSAFRTMGSEDMSVLMEGIPGCYFFIGSANPAMGLNAPHHHPRFDVDETALINGTALMTAALFEYLAN